MNILHKNIEFSWGVRTIDLSSDELLQQLDRKEWYTPELARFSQENRRREWLSVRVLLKELIGEEKEILYTPTGKPYLVDGSYQISFSHTKGAVAVATSPTQAVGIDIEHVSPRIHKIKNRFMSETELASIKPDCEIIHLLLHWSAKESLFKVMGEENVDFRTQLQILPFCPKLGKLFFLEAKETRTEKCQTYSIQYFANENYVLTITNKQ